MFLSPLLTLLAVHSSGRWADHCHSIWFDSIQSVSWRPHGRSIGPRDSADPHRPPLPLLPALGGARKLRNRNPSPAKCKVACPVWPSPISWTLFAMQSLCESHRHNTVMYHVLCMLVKAIDHDQILQSKFAEPVLVGHGEGLVWVY